MARNRNKSKNNGQPDPPGKPSTPPQPSRLPAPSQSEESPELHVADISDTEQLEMDNAILEGKLVAEQLKTNKLQQLSLAKRYIELEKEQKDNAERRNGFLRGKGFKDPVKQNPKVENNRLVAQNLI